MCRDYCNFVGYLNSIVFVLIGKLCKSCFLNWGSVNISAENIVSAFVRQSRQSAISLFEQCTETQPETKPGLFMEYAQIAAASS